MGGNVFYPDGSCTRLESELVMLNLQFDLIDRKSPAIALYDGAPKVEAKCRMICFTSYDASWFLAAKDMVNVHATLFMPTWSIGELKEARKVLNLETTDKRLEANYVEFGGIPRV